MLSPVCATRKPLSIAMPADPREPIDAAMIRERILALASERGNGKTICPSEVSRSFHGTDEKKWRRLMQPVRGAAIALAREGVVVLKRKGRIVDPGELRGIYRIGLPPDRE